MPKSPTPKSTPVELAKITPVDKSAPAVEVHFNPVSLQLSINNQLKKNKAGAQYIGTTTMKLTMDLIFDTTHSGKDVTVDTRKIQAFLGPETPPDEKAENGPPPPRVEFEWGTIKFEGIIEGYKETIDFFGAHGVPLRSSVNLIFSRTDRIFGSAKKDDEAVASDGNFFDAPAQSAAEAGNNAAAPGAARAIAASNGQESLRFGSGAGLTVGGAVELKAAVAFSTGGSAGLSLGGGAGLSLGGGAGLSLGGGAGLSLGGGAGLSLGGGADLSLGGSAGFGAGAGAGFNLGGSAGFGVSGSLGAGVSASAGIAGQARLSATEGAFSGLRISTGAPTSVRFEPSRLVPKITSASAATDAGAIFQIGGKASVQSSSGLRADVGATGKLSFDAS